MHATKETAPLAVGSMLLALALTLLADRRRGRAVPDPIRSVVRRRDARAGRSSRPSSCPSLLFSSFLGHPRGLVDSVRAYGIYLDRAGTASWHFHPWDYYLRLLIHFPARGTPFWTEGLIVVLAAVGGRGRLERPGSPGDGLEGPALPGVLHAPDARASTPRSPTRPPGACWGSCTG